MASLEGLCDRPRSQVSDTLMVPSIGGAIDDSAVTESADGRETMEFGTCVMSGYLFKKERFGWNKMYCLIRNSFLECHKPGAAQGPTLKLFLPRSSITPDREVKRQWAFKVKHPRREGVLQFAAENEEEHMKWMTAFNSAAAIEVWCTILYVCMYMCTYYVLYVYIHFCIWWMTSSGTNELATSPGSPLQVHNYCE